MSIATSAFSGCTSLISIELPEERLFDIALSGCLSLVSLVGPVSRSRDCWQDDDYEAPISPTDESRPHLPIESSIGSFSAKRAVHAAPVSLHNIHLA
eukprot:scaffold20929_cov69-Cylindrotheca_fusiformis.AAC.2